MVNGTTLKRNYDICGALLVAEEYLSRNAILACRKAPSLVVLSLAGKRAQGYMINAYYSKKILNSLFLNLIVRDRSDLDKPILEHKNFNKIKTMKISSPLLNFLMN